jgi:uncharacterized protein YndB with AHSA1/START domain
MPTTNRSKVVQAPPERVWELISDAEHQPRWWPGVSRMEGVVDDRFTQVHMTSKGRGVRIDFRMLDATPPDGQAPGVLRWEQDVIGTPFERVLNSATTEITVEPAAEGSLVKLTLVQKMRGTSRLGGFMLRRATRTRLTEALENLARIA